MKLCGRFSGSTRGEMLDVIRKCVSPPKIKELGEVMHPPHTVGAECA